MWFLVDDFLLTIFDFVFTILGQCPSAGSGRRNAAGGLDDWEVKIADFVVVLGKDAKKFPDAAN